MSKARKAYFGTFAAIIGFQALLPPVVGFANNGDFVKVVGGWGLGSPPEFEFKYISTSYTFDQKYKYWAGNLSSEQAIAAAAVAINGLVSKDGGFDIRIIGVLHAALYLGIWILAAPLLTTTKIAQAAISLLALLIFSDVFYAEMFNTFYMDAAALLGLLAFSVGFLRAANGVTPAASRWLMVAGAVVLVTSKTQHAPAGICILVALALPSVGKRIGFSRQAARVAAALVGAGIATSVYWVPPNFRMIGVYDVIFYSILPNSKDVAADLTDLGLDDSYRPYIGTHAYFPESGMQKPDFIAAFSARTSNAVLAGFYLRHPAVAFRLLKNAMSEAGRQRPAMGTFDPSAGRPEFAQSSAFSLWSGWKRRLFESRGGRYVWASLALFGLCGYVVYRGRKASHKDGYRLAGAPQLAGVLASMALIEMLVSALLDVGEGIRHFFLFGVLWDCSVLLLVAMAAGGTKEPAEIG